MTKIFISYRRQDNPDATGRICDYLKNHFGAEAVFMDIENIPAGTDFRQHIQQAVQQCDVMLSIVGEHWVDERLKTDDDFVRVEVESALERDVPVIPVLVGKAVMPTGDLLPTSLSEFAYRNALEVRSGPDFASHMTRLTKAIDQHVEGIAPADESRSSRGLGGLGKREYVIGGGILCALVLVIAVCFAIFGGDKGDDLGGDGDDSEGVAVSDVRLINDMLDVQKQMTTITDRVGQLSVSQLSQQSLDETQTKQLNDLTSQMEELVKSLRSEQEQASLAAEDRLRLKAAEAAISRNRALILVQQGRLDQAAAQFQIAIEIYQQDRQEFSRELARTLSDRGVVEYSQGKEEEAEKNLAAAAEIYAELDGGAQPTVIEEGREAISRGRVPTIRIEKSGVCTITLDDEKLAAFPPITDTYVVEAGSATGRSFTPVQTSKELGKPLLVPPGGYDVLCEPEGGQAFTLVRNVAIESGQKAIIATANEISALTLADPGISGLKVNRIYVVPADTDLSKRHYISQECGEFGAPMLVTARQTYDIIIAPDGGQLVKAAASITSLPGRNIVLNPKQELAVLVMRDLETEGIDLEAIYVMAAGTKPEGYFYFIQKSAKYDQPMLVRAGQAYDIWLKPRSGQPVPVKQNILPDAGEVVEISFE